MVSETSRKVFKCPVHDYISVPREIVSNYIDTPIFQRLRRIEQTSMRPLYPSAHHDRFSHSLGVFHLASIAFRHIIENTQSELLGGIKLEDYEKAFCIAALMHDCAHAPFSHSFEEYYLRSNRAKDLLFNHVDEEYKKDYSRLITNPESGEPSPHEIFSAAIFLKHYKEIFCSMIPGINPVLIARMITGVVFTQVTEIKQEVENCLIMLINGPAIDLDKLDYVMRDSWVSGVCNVRIDMPRLLSALRIDKFDGHLVPSFHKSAFSVIQNVVDGRNFLYRWIYTHHTVYYYDHLLREAGKKLCKVIAPPENQEAFVDAVFSEQVFDRTVESCGVKLYLPCDGDLIFLMKQYRDQIPEIDEFLSRRPKLIPLWKTQAEFDCIFETKPTPKQREGIRMRFPEILSDIITDQNLLKSVLPLRTKPKTVEINEAAVYVSLMGTVRPYSNKNQAHGEEK